MPAMGGMRAQSLPRVSAPSYFKRFDARNGACLVAGLAGAGPYGLRPNTTILSEDLGVVGWVTMRRRQWARRSLTATRESLPSIFKATETSCMRRAFYGQPRITKFRF